MLFNKWYTLLSYAYEISCHAWRSSHMVCFAYCKWAWITSMLTQELQYRQECYCVCSSFMQESCYTLTYIITPPVHWDERQQECRASRNPRIFPALYQRNHRAKRHNRLVVKVCLGFACVAFYTGKSGCKNFYFYFSVGTCFISYRQWFGCK